MKRKLSVVSILAVSVLALLGSAVAARAQTVTKLAALPRNGSDGMATDGTYLYFDGGVTANQPCGGSAENPDPNGCASAIYRVPIAGGTPTLLYVAYTPAQIAIVGTNIFWADPNAGPISDTEILSAPKSGAGPVAPIYVGADVGQPIVDGEGLSTDGTKLYVVDSVGGNVFSLNTDGSGRTQLNSSPHWCCFFFGEQIVGLTLASGTLYTTNNGSANIGFPPQAASLPATGGAFATLASGPPFVGPFGTAVGNNTLFVADFSADTIWQLPLTGGTPTALVSGAPLVQPTDVMFFNNNLYVLDSGNVSTPGAVYEVSLSSNQPPVANAGANQTIECAGPSGASATLNGSGSTAPNGDALTYKWTDPNNNVVATSATRTVTAPFAEPGPTTTTYTLTVTDTTTNLTATATTEVTVKDTTPPTLTLSQTFLSTVIPSASATGATVSLAGIASATDVCDANPTITNNAPVNDFFPIGVTQVEFTATDHSGNSSPSQTLQVQVEYNFTGYFLPILNDGSAIYQSGRTIPVKFALTAADGTIVTNAVANLFVAMTSNLAIGTNDMTPATASGGSDTGTLFRFDPTSGQYIYNLSTSGFASGTWLIRATINDGTIHNVLFSIR